MCISQDDSKVKIKAMKKLSTVQEKEQVSEFDSPKKHLNMWITFWGLLKKSLF